ncbi:pilus assembly PilX family protein [Lampropedia cohaerens]|nr:PilX N-terminal domain-containing pilus assembly protein [Lampropedia cohaerens]
MQLRWIDGAAARIASARHRRAQRGVALFIVMIIVLLTSLLVLWASRSALLHEMVTGNDADYQRAFEAAQAMLRDAEFDILGMTASGAAVPRCGEADAENGRCRPRALPDNVDVTGNGAAKVYFPTSASLDDEDGGDLVVLEDKISKFQGRSTDCAAAICVFGVTAIPEDEDEPPFWEDEDLLEAMKAAGAYYGQYTKAKAGTEGEGNPLLRRTSASDQRAWYWVEPLLFEASLASDAASRFAPRGSLAGNASGIVFRITALAEGRKPGTRVVLQSIFVKQAVAADG